MTVESMASASHRPVLRRPDDALAAASIGTVPILWNNVDLPHLAARTPAETVLDEIARVGYEGTQFGTGFPEGRALRSALDDRGLRLAEVYCSIPTSVDGPRAGALDDARRRLSLLREGGGDVLVVALDGSPERSAAAGRADGPDVPRLSEAGWDRLVALVEEIARETVEAGHRVAFHQHAGTFIETPAEMDRLMDRTDPRVLGVCLDVGHWTVGGGDPVEAARAFGERVVHVHLKDVDPDVLAGIRSGDVADFEAAIRGRIFTELGAGVLDLDGVLGVLAGRGYAGWLMVEQDSCWGPPAESAAIGRRILATALHRLGGSR